MNRLLQIVTALSSAIILLNLIGVSSVLAQSPNVIVGSQAPQLHVSTWQVSSKSSPVPVKVLEYTNGKVYVVDFWATWCGPCISSMPHLAELQQQYGESKLTTICVTDEDWETVSDFLETPREIDGEAAERTLAEVLSKTLFVIDANRKSHSEYLEAAGINSIPTTFIVGKTGLIEWVGHPSELSKTLADVINDTWDRSLFIAEYTKRTQLNSLFQNAMQFAMNGQASKAKQMLMKAAKDSEDPQVKSQIQMMIEMIDSRTNRESDSIDFYRDRLASLTKKPNELNGFARWLAKAVTNEPGLSPLLSETIAILEREIPDQENGRVSELWHSIAIMQMASGNIDNAIESQTKSLESATKAAVPRLQKYLNGLKQAKEDASSNEQNPFQIQQPPLEV